MGGDPVAQSVVAGATGVKPSFVTPPPQVEIRLQGIDPRGRAADGRVTT
jgi:hypothetical protein